MREGAAATRRYGSVIRLRAGQEARYRELHAAVWPEVSETIRRCNIRNYTIFYRGGWLFSYFEYVGADYAADMARMAADPATQRWWDVCMPLQEPLEDRAEGEWWTAMDEVFHQD
jgi:L-rhamnose mutarotase